MKSASQPWSLVPSMIRDVTHSTVRTKGFNAWLGRRNMRGGLPANPSSKILHDQGSDLYFAK